MEIKIGYGLKVKPKFLAMGIQDLDYTVKDLTATHVTVSTPTGRTSQIALKMVESAYDVIPNGVIETTVVGSGSEWEKIQMQLEHAQSLLTKFIQSGSVQCSIELGTLLVNMKMEVDAHITKECLVKMQAEM